MAEWRARSCVEISISRLWSWVTLTWWNGGAFLKVVTTTTQEPGMLYRLLIAVCTTVLLIWVIYRLKLTPKIPKSVEQVSTFGMELGGRFAKKSLLINASRLSSRYVVATTYYWCFPSSELGFLRSFLGHLLNNFFGHFFLGRANLSLLFSF